MKIKSFDQLSSLELDTLREISSIGTGNAATALSDLLNREVRITLPDVRIMGYNEAIDWIGGPEAVTAHIHRERGDSQAHGNVGKAGERVYKGGNQAGPGVY